MTESQQPSPPQKSEQEPELSYEQAREQLMGVVQRLESGGTPLAESLALWEEGERLAGICQHFLDGAQATVDARRSPGDDQADQAGSRSSAAG